MEDINLKKSFCVLPWIHSFVNFNGNYQVCCTSEEYLSSIPNDVGKPFNIQDAPSLLDVMNSDTLKKLRLDMLQGVWNSTCARCFEAEKMGGVSRRNIENAEYADLVSELVDYTELDGSIKLYFKSIDYRLGNLCNLKCRMCNPRSSSAWVTEWNQAKPTEEQITSSQAKEYFSYDWIEKSFVIEEFNAKLKHVSRLHFAGGEPLIAPQMAKMLKICVDQNLAGQITLSYNTNITKLPKEVLELWKYFKGVQLLCSVDGIGNINDYIRHPSKWEIIDKNLSFLDEHADEYNISEIILSCTVQIYNVLDLRDFYSYLKKFKKIVRAPNLINIHEPVYMQTTLLPEEAKDVASKRLLDVAQSLENQLHPQYEYLRENIFQVINYMNQEDRSNMLFTFKKVNTGIDKVKGLSLHHSAPELNSYLHNHLIKML